MEEAVAGPASDRRDSGKGIPHGKHDLLRRRELEGAGHSGQRARRKTVHASGGLSARVSEGGEHGSEDLRGGGSLLQGGGCFDARIRRYGGAVPGRAAQAVSVTGRGRVGRERKSVV